METKLLSPIQRQRTVADQVAERLVLAIASGEQQAGSRLTEGSIAGAMNVSRVPAREALLSLAAKGLLESAGARGLKVVDFASQQAVNVREVRIALEAVAMRRAMDLAQKDASVLAPLDAVLGEMAGLAAEPNALALAQCDLRFHGQILALSSNDILKRCWEDLTPHLLVLFCKDWHNHPNGVGEVQLHTNLRNFIARGDPRLIEAALAEHFTLGN
ncbi:GntR family transcriptional regulator [Telmatospirillum sp.]|uniref:GntR family transcriptional regulator n=1 Tax=Telmatospirillum sp. TaxID=2079197 RepID=UPI00284F213D|nr:GntR family transcriptional regulator [Telmatospirillum sp.]MDR3435441.1 GntR family transcriptional regulator [Telmatospirillum sp.]